MTVPLLLHKKIEKAGSYHRLQSLKVPIQKKKHTQNVASVRKVLKCFREGAVFEYTVFIRY